MSFVQLIDKERVSISWGGLGSSLGKGIVALIPYFLGWLIGLIWWVLKYGLDAFVVGFRKGNGA